MARYELVGGMASGGDETMNDQRSANSFDLQLGKRVRARRLEIGVSQEKLAEMLGVTFQQVQKYEKGVNRIAASRLFDIADALKMDVCDFFTRSSKAPPREVEGVLATRDGMRLFALYASIDNAKLRRKIVDLVDAMATQRDA